MYTLHLHFFVKNKQEMYARQTYDVKRLKRKTDSANTMINLHFAIMLSPSPMTNLKKMKLLKCSTYRHIKSLLHKTATIPQLEKCIWPRYDLHL